MSTSKIEEFEEENQILMNEINYLVLQLDKKDKTIRTLRKRIKALENERYATTRFGIQM